MDHFLSLARSRETGKRHIHEVFKKLPTNVDCSVITSNAKSATVVVQNTLAIVGSLGVCI
jgi:hypothetical protein